MRVADQWEAFLSAWPEYTATGALHEIRAREFARLDAAGHVYLDYTGAGLYGESQVRRHMALLLDNVLGNPHSSNPTSQISTELVEAARRHVLAFFNASPDDYCVIFTANASHALTLVGESYPFEPGSRFLLTFDNHNWVNGIREFARARGADISYIPVVPPDMRVKESDVEVALADVPRTAPALFAYPAQSNFSGVQHPLEWVDRAHDRGWDVLLDAAAFVPTNRLDLHRWRPEFVVLSFYKIFGYPTGVGALLARWPALAKLHRPWFAGGTISLNFSESSGAFIDHQAIEAKASERGISSDEMKACFARSPERMTYDDFRRCVDGKSSGAVRVSLGLASNFADVQAFLDFARGLLT